jgi:hypothetical protein
MGAKISKESAHQSTLIMVAIQAESFQFANCGLEAGDNVRLAVEQKTCIDDGNAG